MFKLPKDAKIVILEPDLSQTWFHEHHLPKPRFADGERVYCKFAKQFGKVERVWMTTPVNYGIRFDDGKAATAGEEDLIRDVLGQIAEL